MRNRKGQALTETILIIPLLALLIFGLVQFAVFFSAKSAFEFACGQMARQYACGRISEGVDLSDLIWNALGSYQRFFNAGSLQISASPFTSQIGTPFLSTAALMPGSASSFLSKAQGALLNYSGQTWVITLQYSGLPFSHFFMPNGVRIQTQLAVLKYPSETLP
jgi:Flp pilus assembly protein TadG